MVESFEEKLVADCQRQPDQTDTHGAQFPASRDRHIRLRERPSQRFGYVRSMAGSLALVGSGEFLPSTEDVDRALLAFDQVPAPRVAIIPTASGQEGEASVNRWIDLGVDRYTSLGAQPVPIPAVDTASANDPELASLVDGCDLIYFSGGDPTYVTETMRGSLVWRAVLQAWQHGSALAGCSAGAMMMGSVTASPRSGGVQDGLGVLQRLCVLPHFDRFDGLRPGMTQQVLEAVPVGTVLVGVDEHTGLVHDGAAWTVRGQQTVSVFESGERTTYEPGETVPLEIRSGA